MSAEFFIQHQPFAFELFNPPLIAGDKGFALAFHDAIQKGFDLRADLGQAVFDLRPKVVAVGGSAVREGVQFLDEAFEGLKVRRDPRNQSVEVPFEIGPANGFAIAGASVLGAEIIGMLVACLAGGPAGRQRGFAVRTDHKAAQRKVQANILSGGRFRPGAQKLLDFLEGGERDQPFVLSLAEGDAPAGQFQIPGIERLGQQFRHALIADFAIR